MLHDSPVQALRARVDAADALLIATPEYNQSMPGALKNAIDWLSRPTPHRSALEGKPVALVGATSGRWGTRLAQAAVRHTLFAADAIVLTGPALYLADAGSAFDASGMLIDARVSSSLDDLLAFLVRELPVRSRSTTGA
jgi:chromate reductase